MKKKWFISVLVFFPAYTAYKIGLPIQNQPSYDGLDIVRHGYFFRQSTKTEVKGAFSGDRFKVLFRYQDFREVDISATYVVVEQGCIHLQPDEYALLRPLHPCIGVWITGINKDTKQKQTFVAHVSIRCDPQDLLDKLDTFISCHEEVEPVYYYSFIHEYYISKQKYFERLLIERYNQSCGVVGVLFNPEHAFSDTYRSNRSGRFTDVQVSVLIHEGQAYNTSLEDLYDTGNKTVENCQIKYVSQSIQGIREKTWQPISGKSCHFLVPIDEIKDQMRLKDFWTAPEIQFPLDV